MSSPISVVNGDKFDGVFSFISNISAKFNTIAFSYLASLDKIEALRNINWYEEGMDRREAKGRMKELGGSIFQYQDIIYESYILLLAKAMEDTSIELRTSSARFKFHPFTNTHNVIYIDDVQKVSALSNIIKHNRSVIERSSSASARFLVDSCNVEDQTRIVSLEGRYGNTFSLLHLIPKCYLAAFDLLNKSSGWKSPMLDFASFEEAAQRFYTNAIPEVLGIKLPEIK